VVLTDEALRMAREQELHLVGGAYRQAAGLPHHGLRQVPVPSEEEGSGIT
jgi:hypothetical protein